MLSPAEKLASRYLVAIRRSRAKLQLFGSTTPEQTELLHIAISLPVDQPLDAALRSNARAMRLVESISDQAAQARERGDAQARLAGWNPPSTGGSSRDDAIGMLWESLFAYLPTTEESLGVVRSRIRPHLSLQVNANELISIDEIVRREAGFTVRTRFVRDGERYESDRALHDQSGIAEIQDDLARSYVVHVGHGSVRRGRRVKFETVLLCVPPLDPAADRLILRADVSLDPFGRGASVEIPMRRARASALLARLSRSDG